MTFLNGTGYKMDYPDFCIKFKIVPSTETLLVWDEQEKTIKNLRKQAKKYRKLVKLLKESSLYYGDCPEVFDFIEKNK